MKHLTSRINVLHRYVLGQFLMVLLLCLLGATTLFLVFELFERLDTFLREGSTVFQAVTYMLYKVPLIVQLMMPIAVLVATLMSIGRLSQNSEITAMRACGVSLLWLARPLLVAGFALSVLTFITGETVVPWATRRGEELYHLDIKKKAQKGNYSRSNFWYRSQNRFFNIGFYNSSLGTLDGFMMLEFDDRFDLTRRLDASKATWQGPLARWTIEDVTEVTFDAERHMESSTYRKLPLVIGERPPDFYNTKVNPETMNYAQLSRYIEKLRADGVPTIEQQVARSAKISGPFVNLIVILIAFPFALIPARSGTLTASFVAGVSIGFAYHVVHALSTSLGSAELIPILPAAWAANILLGSIGGYLMAGAEHS